MSDAYYRLKVEWLQRHKNTSVICCDSTTGEPVYAEYRFDFQYHERATRARFQWPEPWMSQLSDTPTSAELQRMVRE